MPVKISNNNKLMDLAKTYVKIKLMKMKMEMEMTNAKTNKNKKQKILKAVVCMLVPRKRETKL